MKKFAFITLLILQFILLTCTSSNVKKETYDYSKMDRTTIQAYEHVDQFLQAATHHQGPVNLIKHSKIDTILIDKSKQTMAIHFNYWFGSIALREESVAQIKAGIKKALGRKFKKYTVTLYSGDYSLDQLVPNYYRHDPKDYDLSRMPGKTTPTIPIVRNVSNPWQPTKGLYDRHIALWPSHGWYYEQKLDRWEWQRARVFQTVEDLLPYAFTHHYLIPMLENAGAQVFIPRERDIQTNEVIVDNDTADKSYIEYSKLWKTAKRKGFAIGIPPYTGDMNPFALGTSRCLKADTQTTAHIRWIPDIPETGEYAVYVAYDASEKNVTDAHYTVHHSGGQTDFLVNQQMGGHTWIYLGEFKFIKGQHAEDGSVELSNLSTEKGMRVSADAVRFGGGMGNISRNGQVSGRPRFMEAARYYLQYTGMPDTLVYNLNEGKKDYNDDYQSRGEWVDYLKGAPYGPNRNRMTKGLGIPIDLSLGFHTDAGYTRNDTVIGTLSIYSTDDYNDSLFFPDGMSRLANRDFADILQTQIVDDIRSKYDPVWNRRFLWDRGYSEAARPNVPAALLELLSHHNFLDMKFALDPDFRFHASRSIYKAMLKFLATQNQVDYVVQPLPVSHFQTTLTKNGKAVLKWKPTSDPLEPSAEAKKYIVFTRISNRGFDNGILLEKPEFTTEKLEPGTIYSFKVSAVNDGGASFPSEILSVCYQVGDANPTLIVNGFDRIAAPATIETKEYLGFANFWDQGVPDGLDLNFIGDQYDFRADSPWLDDDAPGHGASNADYEARIIPGNTFDFPLIHGQSILATGHSFVSASDEAVMDGDIDMAQYKMIDFIMGEEKTTPGPKPITPPRFRAFPKQLQAKISRYCESGGNLFITGAYIGLDLFDNRVDSLDMDFARNVLKYRFMTDHAVVSGKVKPVQDSFSSIGESIEFNTKYIPEIYRVESPDALEPADSSAVTLLRYAENNTSAAVGHKGKTDIVVFGFPFETILSPADRDRVMQTVMDFFDRE